MMSRNDDPLANLEAADRAPPVIELKGQPLAKGGFRHVFQHPDDPRLLVKVLKPATDAEGFDALVGRFRRYGLYTPYMREIREYVAVHARLSRCPPFLARCFGLAETDRGLGMVVEKLAGADGGLAPTLASLAARQGMSERLRVLADAFYDDVRRSGIVVSDLNPRNIVLASEAGVERLVLVDGLGEKTWIPIRTMSAAINRYKTDRYIARSKEHVERSAQAGAQQGARNGD